MIKIRKLMVIVLSTILFSVVLSTILGAVTKNYAPKYGTTSANVIFRSRPVVSTVTKLKQLTSGTQVKMVAEVGDFYVVQLGTNEVGYVSKSYVKSSTTTPSGALVYTSKTPYNAVVKNANVNLRIGPSTSFKVLKVLNKDEQVQVIGAISNFNLVLTSDNTVGMIRSDLIAKVTTQATAPAPTTQRTAVGSTEEEKIISLINAERKKAGLPLLMEDAKLMEVAGLKSDDMVKKNYFSHTSPSYGSPFDMMKNFGITYRAAGENIAGNPSLDNAVKAWMNSEGHRKNILSNAYNYIGVGVTKSDVYGYVISAMFIGR